MVANSDGYSSRRADALVGDEGIRGAQVMFRLRSGASFVVLTLLAAGPAFGQIFPRDQTPGRPTPAPSKQSSSIRPMALAGCGEGVPDQPFDAPSPPERKKMAVSPGGVDMRGASLNFQNVDVSIGGEGDAGLALTRNFSYKDDRNAFRQAFGSFFTHNWDIQLQERRLPRAGACYPNQWDYSETVVYGDIGDNFRKASGAANFSQTAPYGFAELKYSGGANAPNSFVFTAKDGTIVSFMTILANVCQGGGYQRCGYATSIKRPDGTLYTLEYETLADGVGKRLRSVVSNRGFALLFEYSGSVSGFQQTSKICALNLAITVKPSNNICPPGVATATYSYNGIVQTSATEASGGTWGFGKPSVNSFSITRPDASQPYMTSGYSFVQGSGDEEPSFVIDNQQFASGESYSYNWSVLYNNDGQGTEYKQVLGGSWSDAQGRGNSVTFGSYRQRDPESGRFPTYIGTPGPESVTDEVGQTTHFNYCGSTGQGGLCIIPPLRNVTYPEGNVEALSYAAYRNIYQVTKKAKPGSSLANIVDTRNYANTTNPFTRAKPISLVDGRNNTISFTYDETHGGVLTQTQSAGGDNVQPVKRFSYIQRYAWLSNGGGGFVRASSPVWLLSQERTCRTSATQGNACAAGSGDEVVTTYEYGPDDGSVGNNLLVRGIAVTADGRTRRTCFGYDGQGNRIWETKPRAGLGVCQ